MNIENLKTNIDFLDQENLTVELFFLFRDNDELSVKSVSLTADIQAPIVKDIISPYIKKEINLAEDIIDYDPSITPDRRSLFKLQSSEVEQFTLAMTEVESIDDFNHEDGYDDIWGYMIKVSQGENEIIAVRKKFSSHILKKGFSLWNKDGQFAKFDNKVFTLDERVDAFLVNGEFFIFQRTNFEQVFIYNIQLELQAKRNAKELVDQYNLLDLSEDKISEYLDKPSISKLRKIDMSLVEDGTMSYTNLNQFCNDFGIEIEKDDTSQTFKPKDKKEFKFFIKLLSDDYLKSGLTERKYDVHSKEILR